MEIKHIQNSKLSELAVFKGESFNNRKGKCADKSIIAAFGDLMFAQLGSMPLMDGEKTKDFNLDEKIKGEGATDHSAFVAATWYQQESFSESNNSIDLALPLFIELHEADKFNAVNAVNRITDKALDLSSLKDVDTVGVKKFNINKGIPRETSQVLKEKDVLAGAVTIANHRTEEVSLPYQGIVHEEENLSEKKELRKIGTVEEAGVIGKNMGNQLKIDKQQIWNPVGQMKGQEENPTNHGANLIKEVNQVDVVNHGNAVNQITGKTLDLSPLKEVDNVEAKKFDINKKVFQEISQVLEENLPEKEELRKIGTVEEDGAIGKNLEDQLKIEKQQIRNSVGQMKGQEENSTNNGANLIKEANQVNVVNHGNVVNQKKEINLVNAVNQITDKTLDLSPLKEVDNVEAKKFDINKEILQETSYVLKGRAVMEGAETKANHRTEEVSLPYQRIVHEEENLPEKKELRKIGTVEEAGAIGKNLGNQLKIDKQQIWNPVGQMKGQEENSTNHGANLIKEANQVNVVDQITDKTLDLSPLKEVDNVEAEKFDINEKNFQETSLVIKEKIVFGGAETKVNYRTEEVSLLNQRFFHEEENLPEKKELTTLLASFPNERKTGALEEDGLIGKNLEDQVMIEKQMIRDPAGQMKGREENPINGAIKMGLDKLPLHVGELIQRVSIEKKQHSWELQLEPEKLGKLRIIVNWDRGKISAEFFVETGQTAKALENYLDTLKQNLGQKNIDVSSLSISVASQSTGGGSQGLPQPFSRRERGFVPRSEDFSLPVQEEGANILEGISVNYLV